MLTSYLIQLLAISLLSLSMLKHFRAAFSTSLSHNAAKVLKLIGWLLLILSFNNVIAAQHPGLMSVYWLCFLSLNIIAVALIHSKMAHK